MERKCHCGEVIKSFNRNEISEAKFKAYHYFCHKCRLNFTVLIYPDSTSRVFNGFIGKTDKI